MRFYHVDVVESASTKSDKFLSEFSSWLEASYVRDTTAVEELSSRLKSSDLSEDEDSFVVAFRGDYSTEYSSSELRSLTTE